MSDIKDIDKAKLLLKQATGADHSQISLIYREFPDCMRAGQLQDDDAWSAYLGTGFIGEIGEAYSIAAKTVRGDSRFEDDEEAQKAILKELGDIGFFFMELIRLCGFTLEQVLLANMVKLVERADQNSVQGDGDDR